MNRFPWFLLPRQAAAKIHRDGIADPDRGFREIFKLDSLCDKGTTVSCRGKVLFMSIFKFKMRIISRAVIAFLILRVFFAASRQPMSVERCWISWIGCVLWSANGLNHTQFSENYTLQPAQAYVNPHVHSQMNRYRLIMSFIFFSSTFFRQDNDG